MAEKRKSLIDEALLESKEIEKAFETNAKEILGRTMGSEIEEMVKETLEGKDSVSLNEDEDDEETLELLDLDDASSAGEEDLDIELGDEEMDDMEDMGDMEDMDSDEIEMDDEDMDSDEIEYQIELDGDDEDSDEMDDDMSEGDYMEDGMEENRGAHTLGNASRIANRKSSDINSNRVKMGESKKPKFLKLVNENKVLKNKISSVVSESETLKEDYNKMVDALKQFRNKLNEVAVFNSNLTYSVRLFTENTTTKDEKLEIIKRFDDAKTLKESKGVYKSLIKEISKKEPIKESIDVKLNESKSSGSATEITESKVYVDPQIEKMKKLWSYEYKN